MWLRPWLRGVLSRARIRTKLLPLYLYSKNELTFLCAQIGVRPSAEAKVLFFRIP